MKPYDSGESPDAVQTEVDIAVKARSWPRRDQHSDFFNARSASSTDIVVDTGKICREMCSVQDSRIVELLKRGACATKARVDAEFQNANDASRNRWGFRTSVVGNPSIFDLYIHKQISDILHQILLVISRLTPENKVLDLERFKSEGVDAHHIENNPFLSVGGSAEVLSISVQSNLSESDFSTLSC